MEPMIMATRQDPVSAWIAANDGLRVPYDCPTCDAEEVIVANRGGRGVHAVEVRHDDGCAWLEDRRRQQRKQRQQQWKRRSPKVYRPQDGDNR